MNMNRNQIFSLKRFINLIKSDLLINYKKYGLQLLVIFLLGYGMMYLSLPKHSYQEGVNYDTSRYFSLFVTALFALGAFAGLSFPAFNHKNKSRVYLLTPASTFEKYTAQILGRIVIGTILFLIIFWIDARLARFTILNTVKENIPEIEKFTYSGIISRLKMDVFTLWLFPFISLSIGCFLFSVKLFFGKNGLVKTGLSMGGVLFITYLLFALLTQILYPETPWFEVKTPDYQITGNLGNGEIFSIVIFSISWIFFLIFGFFKLKEKEL